MRKRAFYADDEEDEDDDEDDFDEDEDETSDADDLALLNARNVKMYWEYEHLAARSEGHLSKRSSKKYTVRFKTKCGKFRCQCTPEKRGSKYSSENPLTFATFNSC